LEARAWSSRPNRLDKARLLLQHSLRCAPKKVCPTVLVEFARLEEYAGDVRLARAILAKAKVEAQYEWKVFLEAVLLEVRDGQHEAALREARAALENHRGTGRLWAMLIQLHGVLGHNDDQVRVFKEALHEVPKSGEVWCEGARIMLARGHLAEARQYLDYAVQFTPQYGDSFIECMRVEMLEKSGSDVADALTRIELSCINADPNYGSAWLYAKMKRSALDGPLTVLRTARDWLKSHLTFDWKEQIKLLTAYGNKHQAIFAGESVKV
jgi:tetratricopeptide (TPR) repeat protein